MSKLNAAWNRFWFDPIDPISSAMSRICLGLLITSMYVALAPNWERFFAADGIRSLADLEQPSVERWSLFELTEKWTGIGLYWWIGFVSAVSLTLGWKTRWVSLVLFVMQSSMMHRNRFVANGEDLVFRMILFYGCFASWGETLSLDAWQPRLRQGIVCGTKEFGGLGVRLMQVNIALIYLISVPYKIAQDSDWLTGDAMHWTIASDTWWIRGFLPELTYGLGGLPRKVLTWGTLLVEGTFPILVCLRPTRVYSVLALTSLHLGIALLIPNVTLFTLAMAASFWIYLPADLIRQKFDFLKRALKQGIVVDRSAIQRRCG